MSSRELRGVGEIDPGATTSPHDENGNAPVSPQSGNGVAAVAVNAKGKPELPPIPGAGDYRGQAAWLTAVLALHPRHPIVGGRHLGGRGEGGIVEFDRLDAAMLVFDPASIIGTGAKLTSALVWQLIDGDGSPHPWTNPQAATIAYVARSFCTKDAQRTPADDARAAVVALLEFATEVDQPHTIRDTTARRFEAVRALAPPVDDYGRPGRPNVLVDCVSGETVVRVSDLADIARRLQGSLRHGWLDAAMTALGWRRVGVQGYALPGRDGRRGPHARCDVYRGRLEVIDQTAVNT